ncbi:MAG: hypothetical protein KAR06_00725 [Deltaproteobacteria bacterium]|nr:hypothetical protein [Deltaproteobacteria bacterium]
MIQSFEKGAEVRYVPEYGSNRLSKQPCVITLKYVSHARAQEYSRLMASRVKSIHDPEEIAKLGHGLQKEQFLENVVGIEGYALNGEECDSTERFYDTAPPALIKELCRAMEDAFTLSEYQEKNSEPASDGSQN